MERVDLRSDTVTLPSERMRQAILSDHRSEHYERISRRTSTRPHSKKCRNDRKQNG
jgi:hypothetical protein